MPPRLALALGLLGTVVLLWRHGRRPDSVSAAVYIPLLWVFTVGTRYVSQWLWPDANSSAVGLQMDGSPVDRAWFALLIAGGLCVLWARGAAVKELLLRNKLTCLFFLFGLVSVCWSEYPLIAFKRWFKATGNIVMVLVLLTERDPKAAVGTVFRQFAILTLPLSVVYVKYFPELGRTIHHGTQLYTGVALNKNTLGQMCLLIGAYLGWSRLYQPGEWRSLERRILLVALAAIGGWLLYMANSATSLGALSVGLCFMLLSRLPPVASRPQRLLGVAVAATVGLFCLEMVVGIADAAIAGLGRDSTLTTRVPMWEDLLRAPTNALIGSGYESFWLTGYGQQMQARWGVFQAHNGYLELYLNLGAIGVLLVVGSALIGLLNVRRSFEVDPGLAVLKFSLIPIVVLYNWTEATFYGPNNMWLLFLFGTIEAPLGVRSPSSAGAAEVRSARRFELGRPVRDAPRVAAWTRAPLREAAHAGAKPSMDAAAVRNGGWAHSAPRRSSGGVRRR